MQRKMEWISGTAHLLGGRITKTSDSRNGAQIQDSRSQVYAGFIDSAYYVFLATNSYWRDWNNSNNTELIRTSLPVGALSAYF